MSAYRFGDAVALDRAFIDALRETLGMEPLYTGRGGSFVPDVKRFYQPPRDTSGMRQRRGGAA